MMHIRIGCVGLVFVALVASDARAATLTVDGDGGHCPRAEFALIQAAVDHARPGDTVKVCPGVYAEQVTVTTPITLRGPGDQGDCASAGDPGRQAIVDPANDGFTVAFRLAADDVVVRGFVIQDASVGVETSDEFSGYRVSHNLVQSNALFAIDAGSAGTYASRFDHNCLRANGYGLVSELDDDSRWPQPPVGTDRSAYARNLRNARVDHNQTAGNGSGVEAAGPGRPVDVSFDHNHSQGDGVGVAIQNSVSSAITANEILDATGNAIAVGGNNHSLVIAANLARSRNSAINLVVAGFFDVFSAPTRFAVISENDLRSQTGGGLTASSNSLADSLIEANTLDANGTSGLALAPGNTANEVRDNEANGNGRNGIFLVSGATANTLVGNVMHGNGTANALTFFDARDDNTPLNTWIGNDCDRDSPAGAICGE